MRVTDEIRYQASLDSVFEMLTNADFQERKCQATGALEQRVDVVEHSTGEVAVTTERVLPTDTIPEVFRSMLGGSLRVIQVETWQADDGSGERSGTIEVSIAGTPVGLTGTLRLSPDGADGGASVEHIDGQLRARVPLVGGKIEQAVAPAIRAAIRAERRTGTAWLASDGG